MKFQLVFDLRGARVYEQNGAIPLLYPQAGETVSLRGSNGVFVGPYKVFGVHHHYTDDLVKTTVHLTDGP